MTQDSDRELTKRRRHSRVSLLKRRATVASILGFATLFGLAAEHTVKSASTVAVSSSSGAATPTRFFDEESSSFSFDEGVAGSTPTAPQTQSSRPVAQTNVS